MSIIINATRSTTYWSYADMSAKFRVPNKDENKEVSLSAKKEEVKPVELSKKEEAKAPVALAPETEDLNVALSPASEVSEEIVAEEAQIEEQVEAQAQEELEIVVKPDELPNQPTNLVDVGNKEDEMDYNEDGEVTLDEKMRHLEEQSKSNSLPEIEVENNSDENAFGKIQTNEVKPIEVKQAEVKQVEVKQVELPEQKAKFDNKQLEGVQKFNYNNLQKAYFAKPQTAQHTVTRVA